jgi:5-methyltetrahydropteroyltriglutamate--homocysteine methyltransferase
MGAQRELKFAIEKHWRGALDAAALEAVATELRTRHWALQKSAGLSYVTVGDFAFYDQVANHIQLFGCEPTRFGFANTKLSALERYFVMARGQTSAPSTADAWFVLFS